MSKKYFLRGTLILTCTGLVTRLIGFFYRIFLSHSIGAQGMGIYQLTLPVQSLAMAVTTAGIQTALSRMIASRFALGKASEAKRCLLLGTLTAFLLSVAAAWIVSCNAAFFAVEILKEPQTQPLLRLLAFSFPLSTLHTCVNSYYFARKKAGIPSGIQLLEQLARVGTTYLLYLICLSEHRDITALPAIGGTLGGEAAATLVSLLFIAFEFQDSRTSSGPRAGHRQISLEIFRTALPLTLNRILLTLLRSIEMVLIPQRLRMSGLASAEALSIYGVFTGMALPLILFPSAVTNSASVLLMPSVAELQALGYRKRIRYVTRNTILCCFALGCACSLLFFFFGKPIGVLLFRSPTAGTYIRTMAFICPFLYSNTTLVSILHGTGKTGLCLAHNLIGVSIRIAFVLAAIPLLGIRGYLYGILLSEFLLTLLHIRALYR